MAYFGKSTNAFGVINLLRCFNVDLLIFGKSSLQKLISDLPLVPEPGGPGSPAGPFIPVSPGCPLLLRAPVAPDTQPKQKD